MIWQYVLNWLQIDHCPLLWREEVDWIVKECNGKGCRARIMKCSFAKTVYETWKYHNDVCFKKEGTHGDTGAKIVDIIILRYQMKPKVPYLVNLVFFLFALILFELDPMIALYCLFLELIKYFLLKKTLIKIKQYWKHVLLNLILCLSVVFEIWILKRWILMKMNDY